MIVVDDEVLVRVGLRTTTPWESLGCCFLGDAANGAEGLRLIEELKPDIVITDVKMPVMDGLEMIRRSRAVVAAEAEVHHPQQLRRVSPGQGGHEAGSRGLPHQAGAR